MTFMGMNALSPRSHGERPKHARGVGPKGVKRRAGAGARRAYVCGLGGVRRHAEPLVVRHPQVEHGLGVACQAPHHMRMRVQGGGGALGRVGNVARIRVFTTAIARRWTQSREFEGAGPRRRSAWQYGQCVMDCSPVRGSLEFAITRKWGDHLHSTPT